MLSARINRYGEAGLAVDAAASTHALTRGPYSALADARIDDRSALLSKLGVVDESTDCELILAAYERWGEHCTEHLIGDYAFAIIDERQRRIFCARDHMGARPFFYSLGSDQICIASDIRTLVGERLGEIDHQTAASVLASNRYYPGDRTFLRDVRRLPAGHSLLVTDSEAQLRKYWRPTGFSQLELSDDAAYVEAGRALLAEAVTDRLRGSVRPAVHLSGGLDSSAVAAVAANQQRDAGKSPPISYAWHLSNPDDPTDAETRWAEAARSPLDLEMHAPTPSIDDLVALFRSDWCVGPDVSNLLSENVVMKHAQKHRIDTVLSGWGGDESLSFNGRGYRAQLLADLNFRELARICAGPFPISLARGIKQGFGELSGRSVRRAMKVDLGNTYLRPEIADRMELYQPEPINLRSTADAMCSSLEIGAQTARLEDWAVAGRQHGLTYAYPLLDRRVMEFALSLPGDLYFRPGMRRWIMREILDPQLPDLVRYNQSKEEPARVAYLKDLVYHALQRCADMIEDTSVYAGRDALVDVSRLIEDLRGPKDAVMKNLSHKRRAVQFLRF